MKLVKYYFLFFIIGVVLISGCTSEDIPTQEKEKSISEEIGQEPPQENNNKKGDTDNFRLEIPTEAERETLPSCDNIQFTTYPVDMNDVSGITPLTLASCSTV